VRGDVAGQLRRAGAAVPNDFALGDQQVAVMITAAARAPAAAELLERQGANVVWLIDRVAAPAPLFIDSLSSRNRSRRDQSSETIAD
jgi:hypothetical protein